MTRINMTNAAFASGGHRGLDKHVIQGAAESMPEIEPNLITLRKAGQTVTLVGPLELNVSLVAVVELESQIGAQAKHLEHVLFSYDMNVGAGERFVYGLSPELVALGGIANGGLCVLLRANPPKPSQIVQPSDLPCGFAAASQPDTARFFPVGCEPCEGLPMHAPPVCGPALAVPAAAGGCIRPRFFDGMFLTSADLETQLRFFRIKNQLQNRAMGQGVVWGFSVRLVGNAVRVGPGYGVDCCGHDLTITCDYDVARATLLRDPAICALLRECGNCCLPLLLEYVECPESPRPVHAGSCNGEATACEMSRVRETVRLRLVPPRDQTPPNPLAEAVGDLLGLVHSSEDVKSADDSRVALRGSRTTARGDVVPWTLIINIRRDVKTLQPSVSAPMSISFGYSGVEPLPVAFRVEAHSEWSFGRRRIVLQAVRPQIITFDPDKPTRLGFTREIPALIDPKQYKETLTFTWEAMDGGELKGTTQIVIEAQCRQRIVAQGAVTGARRIDVNDSQFVNGVQQGQRVVVQLHVAPGVYSMLGVVSEKSRSSVAIEPIDVIPTTSEEGYPPATVIAILGASASVTVDRTDVELVEQPSPGAPPCCGSLCCDRADDTDPVLQMRVLAIALLYGRLQQQLAATGWRVDYAEQDLTARIRVAKARIDRLLGAQTGGQRRRLEQIIVDLYDAWCRSAIYPGPDCAHVPDGVVIGCAHIRSGEICEIDPLDGRRWVIHPPLIQHWAAQFGLDPVDRNVMRLFSRLCCISHLPGFAAVTGSGLTGKVVAPDASVGPRYSDAWQPTASLSMAALTGLSSASMSRALSSQMRLLLELDCLGLPCLVKLLERGLCPSAVSEAPSIEELPSVSEDYGVLAVDPTDAWVREAMSKVSPEEQPSLATRKVAFVIAADILRLAPIRSVVSEGSPVLQPLLDAKVDTVADLMALPPEDVLDVVLRGEHASEFDEVVTERDRVVEEVTKAVASAIRKAHDARELSFSRDLERDDVRKKVVERVARKLKAAKVLVPSETLYRAFRIG